MTLHANLEPQAGGIVTTHPLEPSYAIGHPYASPIDWLAFADTLVILAMLAIAAYLLVSVYRLRRKRP